MEVISLGATLKCRAVKARRIFTAPQ